MAPAPSLVSVIIITRNRPELFKRAMASIAAQDYRPIEVIVVDNVSDVPVTVEPGDLSLKIHRNAAMRNLSANRNLGVGLASGSLVCFLDDDDYFLPGKLSLLASRMDGADLCYGNTRMVGPGGQTLGVCRGSGGLADLMFYRFVHPNSTLMRRAVLDEVLFDETLTTYEDVDFIFEVFRRFRVRHVDELVAVWNRDDRPDQLTQQNFPRAYRNWLTLCEKHADDIDRSGKLARFYYRKMFLLAAIQWQPGNALRFFWKFVTRGIMGAADPLTPPAAAELG
jgi:glycosyltransferase involved in cell wall biosynthesis